MASFTNRGGNTSVAISEQPKKRRRAFAGAVSNNLTSDWHASNQSADAEIYSGICTLRARSRDLERNNPYMCRFLDDLGANVIGDTGIRVTPRPQMVSGKADVKAAKFLADEYAEFSCRDNFTANGRHSRAEWSRIGIRRTAADGDMLAELVRGYARNKWGFAVHGWEGDYLGEHDNDADKRITMGVRRDDWGRDIGYRLGDTTRNNDVWGFFGSTYSTKVEREIEAEDPFAMKRGSTAMLLAVIHRFSQTRGWPWVACAITKLRQLEMYEEAALISARIGAAKLGFLFDATVEDEGDGDYQGSPTFNADPGSITRFAASPEEMDFKSWDPNDPNADYPAFKKGILQGIASGIGDNYNTLGSDLEGVSFSSIRQGILSERELYKIKQSWWIDWFEYPTYQAWLRWSLMAGRLGKYTALDYDRLRHVEMEGRRWDWVDPLKDVTAAEKAIQIGVSSRQAENRKRGQTFEKTAEEQKEDNEIADKKGLQFGESGQAELNLQDAED